MVVGSRPEGSKTVDLTSTGGGILVGSDLPAEFAEMGEASGVDGVLLL